MLPHVDEDLLIFRDVEVTDFWGILHYTAVDEDGLEARNASGGKTGQVNLLMGLFHLNNEVCDTFHLGVRGPGGGRRRDGDGGEERQWGRMTVMRLGRMVMMVMWRNNDMEEECVAMLL